ncbi:GUN4 domain-containing protein [Anabaenopsis elenkinii]|jgi:hypothetical protein|uniref:GUN4 domain-containing protein n=1 Tax=Anabaenopsis elenkinii CCIBt3563 TaxID=2779889 RepID=A0A7U3NL98_9CYAN|nr:GUN4 domain-containing protein [Anabaenopsis elenkinii]QOV21398.1 GUN4 domain-containing protein [Anabaenopsis elenkinii CCIBt3563]
MTNNQQQPGEYDAVLGGELPAPEFAAVLGGMEGVIFRFSNPNPQVRILGIAQAFNYGEQGLDFLIQALNDESPKVQYAAYSLLQSRTEAKAKEALKIFEDATELYSVVGVDYSPLRDLLVRKRWKAADEETKRVMLAVAEREEEGWLNIQSIDNFPCADLGTIDQLWLKYSDGLFGFSVQKQIYEGLGGTKEWDYEVWKTFGDKVGWRNSNHCLQCNEINCDIRKQSVQMPNFLALWCCVESCFVGGRDLFISLISKLSHCSI